MKPKNSNKQGFKETDVPGGALKNKINFEAGKTYYLRIALDWVAQWIEYWPTFPTTNGMTARRFVKDNTGANFAPIINYIRNSGIPEGLNEQGKSNWKERLNNACIVIVGTDTKKKDKKTGKNKRVISWDKANPKIWQFGIKVHRQLNNIKTDPDLIEQMEDKGLDISEFTPLDVFGLKLTKNKTGAKSYEVEYSVTTGKLYGEVSSKDCDVSECESELDKFMEPTSEAQILSFLEENGEGGGGRSEADSIDETDDDDVTETDDVTEDTEDTEDTEEEETETDEFSKMDRKQLKIYIKKNELDVKVFKSDSEDGIRNKIREAIGKSSDDDDIDLDSLEDDDE